MLLAEQNVSRALQYCDHAYVLEMGKIVLSGPSEQMRDRISTITAYGSAIATSVIDPHTCRISITPPAVIASAR